MTRCLVLDWDGDRCQILAGNETRGTVRIERALTWPQPLPASPAQAEEAGKQLREFLKTSNVAPAPILICVSRQRVLLKEVRIPAVSAAEEPALVRFQAAKELLETPDEVILDYAELVRSATESQVLVAVLRKDLLAGYQALCRGAGLKLLAVSPRPFVLKNVITRSRKIGPNFPASTSEWSAVLLLAEGSAELTVMRGGTVIFSRSLTGEPSLEAELRRSLAMFASQPWGEQPSILYLLGKEGSTEDDTLAASLQGVIGLPVFRPKILAADDAPAPAMRCAAAVGMLQAWAEANLPVNFVSPKEPKPVEPVNQRRWILAGGALVTLLIVALMSGKMLLDGKREQIQLIVSEKDSIKNQLDGFAQERTDIDSLKEWDQTSVPWIDEINDISSRFPAHAGFHLEKVHIEPIARKTPADKFVARIKVNGVEPPGGEFLLRDFLESLRGDHLQTRIDRYEGGKFSVTIDVGLQASKLLAKNAKGPSVSAGGTK